MIFRISQKLNAKIAAGNLATLPPDDNPYADWSCHLFLVERTQYILLTNTRALYSVVMYGRGVTNINQFIKGALSHLRDFLEADGCGLIYPRSIVPNSGTVRFAKSLNRSVTGSMTDLIKLATSWMTRGELSPFDVSFKLNEVPMTAIAGPGETHGFPRDLFQRLGEPETPTSGV